MPDIGFTICHLAFSFPLGVALLRVIFIIAPPGQCLSKCWSKLEHCAGPSLGNLGYVGSCTLRLSGVALRTRYVQLLSGLLVHRAVLLVLFYHCRNVL